MANPPRHSCVIARRLSGVLAVVCLLLGASSASAQGIPEDRVLLLYNSVNAESLAVRNMYIAAHPDVRELDLNNASLSPKDPTDLGNITRTQYMNAVRAPLLAYLSGMTETGAPLSEHIIAIATTRGLPARIQGPNEFELFSSRSSLECELALVQQDLSLAGTGDFTTLFEGTIDNPYHFMVNQPITSFDRSGITSQKSFTLVDNQAWESSTLTPGDMYLVCRLDSAPSDDATALENIQALINRSLNLSFIPADVQALLDEYGAEFDQLDDDGGLFFPSDEDFENARTVLNSIGVPTFHDETFTFWEGDTIPDQVRPLITLGTYGENHDLMGSGANPPGAGVYLSTFTNLHPAAIFISYESFNGNSIINGLPRGNQEQAMNFIANGGSFTVAHVAEPFTFTVADLEMLTSNLLVNGMTFAEAAYSSIPALSWQNTPIGDPLATVVMMDEPVVVGDLNDDDTVNGTDLAILLSVWGTDGAGTGADLNGDGVVNGADLATLLSNWGA